MRQSFCTDSGYNICLPIVRFGEANLSHILLYALKGTQWKKNLGFIPSSKPKPQFTNSLIQ
jgi:hypothetical protein